MLTGLKLKVTTGQGRAGDVVLKINTTIKADEQILVLAKPRAGADHRRRPHHRHRSSKRSSQVSTIGRRRKAQPRSCNCSARRGRTFGCPRLTIKDWPHADYCGVMLDVARQDHPIEAIKKVVQLCRLYKARYLQLHLTDDQGWTFPSTKYPQLGSKNYGTHGGIAPRVYKLEELKELVAYADARGVTIVPELEVPGHSGAALRSLPEIFDAINPQSKQPVGIGCMNMSNEEIYPALDTIIGEMCDVFRSSPYFHIGSDEVTSGRLSLHPGYKAFMAKHGLKDDSRAGRPFHLFEVVRDGQKTRQESDQVGRHGEHATKDVIIMGWENNSTVASEMLARGYTTITCPWGLGVPWEQWNMYVAMPVV